MKITIEVEVNDLNELPHALQQTNSRFYCHNRLQLLKAVSDLAKYCVAMNQDPTLTQCKEVVWNHVLER